MKLILRQPLFQAAIALLITALPGCRALQSPVAAPPSPLPAAQPVPDPVPPSNPVPPSPVAVPVDPFQKGLDKAKGASTLSRDAQIPQDWSLVADQWQQAIDFMQAVPRGDHNYSTAQKLLPTYRDNRVRAEQRAKQSLGKIATAPTRPNSSEGIPLITGSETGGDAMTMISTLNQQQIDFFNRQKRFAANLAELGNPVPGNSLSYTYSTKGEQGKQAVSQAIAKQNGLPSYTGVVYIVKDGNNETPLSAICTTSQSGKSPALPRLVGKDIQCPEGSTRV